MSGGPTDPLAFALNHDLRIAILKYLAAQGSGTKMCSREFAEDLEMEIETAFYHVQVLHESGAIRPVETEPAGGPLGRFYVFDIDEPWVLALLGLDRPGTGV